MKQHVVLFLLSLFVCMLNVNAQDDVAAALKQINAIKVDVQTYLSAESTSAQWEDAYDNAKALLELKIEEWAKDKAKTEDLTGCIAKAENSIFEIKARRGNLYRAFLYVKKSDIMTYFVEKEVVKVPVNNTSQASETEITVKHAAPEMVTVLVPEQPKPESNIAYQHTTAEVSMLKVSSFNDIEPFIKNNNISDYGKHVTMPSVGDFYVFVYNREGDISAYLHHLAEGYFNLKTGSEDQLTNYKGCGAFWFRIK